jgi:hypothetical protein
VKHWVALCDADKLPADSGIPGLQLRSLDRSPVQHLPLAGVRRKLRLQHVLHQRHHRQPQGALYSHRSTLLHAYAAALPDALNLSARDSVLPVVPMFHVNAWGCRIPPP